ncbi:MAG: glycerol-3-phosphate 1-O-acyltransferase PlsY [Candidatus Methylomirabilales bacterium]
MSGLQELSLVCIAYLIGSIPFGLLVSQAVGQVDIRRHGSGNIGTANVLRTVGKRAALLTLLGDLLKGFLPALVTVLLGGSELLVAGVGMAAVLGHNWPIYLRFAGGKGVATSFGALLAMTPLPALLGLLVWLGVILVLRYTSLGALAASVCVPPLIFFSSGAGPYFIFSLLAAFLIFVRHRDNIKRLWAGTEHRVGQRVR